MNPRTAAAILAALLLAFAVGRATAAPRSAPVIPATVTVGVADEPGQGQSEAPPTPGVSPSPVVVSDPPPTQRTNGPSPNVSPARLSGLASWYDNGPGLYAAVPGWAGVRYRATVCTATACVMVAVRDSCGCYVGTPDARIIDLSPAAFRALAPLSRGLVNVTLELL